jgi:hypothetical protein
MLLIPRWDFVFDTVLEKVLRKLCTFDFLKQIQNEPKTSSRQHGSRRGSFHPPP